MTNEETAQCVAFINSSWNSKPLDKVACRTWGAELKPYPFDVIIGVLRSLLRTSEWRPSLFAILAAIDVGPKVKSVQEAFDDVCKQINKRASDRVVTDLEAEAVRRLGGWRILGQWQLDARTWNFKAFREVYDDLAAQAKQSELRALASGDGQRALPEAK